MIEVSIYRDSKKVLEKDIDMGTVALDFGIIGLSMIVLPIGTMYIIKSPECAIITEVAKQIHLPQLLKELVKSNFFQAIGTSLLITELWRREERS